MLHEPAAKSSRDVESPYKTRLGVWMFLVYAVIYAGFVAICVIKPAAMAAIVLFGLNLAVVYGFGLIIIALLMAVVYNRLCAVHETEVNRGRAASGEGK